MDYGRRVAASESLISLGFGLAVFAPAPGQLQADAAAQAHQYDATNAGVVVALAKNVQAQQPSDPEAEQGTTDEANGVGQAFN